MKIVLANLYVLSIIFFLYIFTTFVSYLILVFAVHMQDFSLLFSKEPSYI